ncbi:MAG: DsbA family protein [Pseudomonadota bacterium]
MNKIGPRLDHGLRGAFIAAMLGLGLAACDRGAPSEKEVAGVAASVPEGMRRSEEGGFVMGAPEAPVAVIEYASYTCSHCAEFHESVLPRLKEKYIDTGKVRFEVRSFLRNEPDFYASMVLDCAGPERFEGLATLFFESQPEWLRNSDPNGYVAIMAKRAGFSSSAYDACTSDGERRKTILKATQSAIEAFSIRGTPTLIVDGKVVNDGATWLGLDRAIQNAL